MAPIALYPDGLLTQTFMAATYPLQIVEAARFMEQNPDLKGDALNEKLKEYDWDEAVKSICTFPEVLKKMNDNLDWTQDLGDAMLGQQTELLDAVQVMRNKAYDGGKIESNDQVNVTVEQPDPAEPQIIVIESKDPEVVYVPQYAPATMYPGWGYPSYYYPGMYPYYPPGAGFWGFTAGVIVGGAIWGNCDWGWGGSDVNIDIDRNTNFNRNTNINGGNRVNAQNRAGGKQSWNHNAANRKGVNYRDGATAQKYGGSGSSTRVSSAEARGRSGEAAGTRQAGATTREGAAPERGTGRPRLGESAPQRAIARVRFAGVGGRAIARVRPGSRAARRSRRRWRIGGRAVAGCWRGSRRARAIARVPVRGSRRARGRATPRDRGNPRAPGAVTPARRGPRAARARARAARRARAPAPARRAGRRALTAARAARARLAPRAAAARTAAAAATAAAEAAGAAAA